MLYPQRAIRIRDFLYIHNFAPDPCGLDDPTTEVPSFEKLCNDTFAAYSDMDGSLTKAWMILHRTEENVQELFRLGFGKRPKEELYDLRVDPHHMNNVAGDAAYSYTQKKLVAKLMQILRENNDLRVVEAQCLFDHEPFAGPLPKS